MNTVEAVALELATGLQNGTVELPKKANHRANVVRVGAILPHPNADKLELTMVGGYQLVIGKGQFKTGDLAVYIQPDSVVPQTEPFRFIWGPFEITSAVPGVPSESTVPERRRRITVRRFRKEYSEGLLLPLSDFSLSGLPGDTLVKGVNGWSQHNFTEGEDVSELLGITHYVPEFDRESTKADTAHAPRRRYPKTIKGWFFWALWRIGIRSRSVSDAMEVSFAAPVYDVDALKNHKNWIQDGEFVQVTEKIHGSNARYVSVDGKLYAGSHYQWKQQGDNIWWRAVEQHPEIEEWCHQNPGVILYGEVGPTQKGFRYGTEKDEVFFFAFDTYNPETNTWAWPGGEGFQLCVPPIYVGPFNKGVLQMADGQTVVPGGKNIREGVVVSTLDRRCKLKVVSNKFLEEDAK